MQFKYLHWKNKEPNSLNTLRNSWKRRQKQLIWYYPLSFSKLLVCKTFVNLVKNILLHYFVKRSLIMSHAILSPSSAKLFFVFLLMDLPNMFSWVHLVLNAHWFVDSLILHLMFDAEASGGLAMKKKSNTSNIIVYFFYWAQLLSLITNLCKKHKPFIQFMSFRQKIDIDKHTGIHWHYLTQGNSYILLCVNKKGITRGRSASDFEFKKMGFECYKSIKCK